MKVKYIWNESCTINDFEREINEFIKGKNIVDIKFQPARGGNGVPMLFALVMYEDETVKREKVQLSKHVADWLDYYKSSSRSLQYAINYETAYKENNPVAAAYLARGDEHLLTFARAWFEGFTIENNKESTQEDKTSRKPAEKLED